MTEVKSLKVTADTYRHRGWMWQNRATYDAFKQYMKMPAWVDRILANSNDTQRFVVGAKDGERNAAFIGDTSRGRYIIPAAAPTHMVFNCNTKPNNEFVVLAERIRAKKPDANKTPRPQWRQPMTKPWEPGTLGGAWVVDSKFVKEVRLDVAAPPAWADRLWVSTSANTDTFVWVNSKAKGYTHSGELHAAKHAKGIKGHQTSGSFDYDSVLCNPGCHWQLAGVRKKTVWVPAPEVVQPVPDKPVTATEVREAQREMERVPTGRVPSLNDLICAPYGHDIYSQIAAGLSITRAEAKLRAFRDIHTPPNPSRTFIFDVAALEQRAALAFAAPKTPVGVKPRNLHDEDRANALDEAMVRYLNEDLPFPIEWAIEWNELRARLNKEQK